jgi:hypothetical protein
MIAEAPMSEVGDIDDLLPEECEVSIASRKLSTLATVGAVRQHKLKTCN